MAGTNFRMIIIKTTSIGIGKIKTRTATTTRKTWTTRTGMTAKPVLISHGQPRIIVRTVTSPISSAMISQSIGIGDTTILMITATGTSLVKRRTYLIVPSVTDGIRPLERVFQPKLNLTHRYRNRSYDTGNTRAIVNEVVRLSEIRMIESVKEFRTEFKALRFSEAKLLSEGAIEYILSWAG
jgi:hypothetical protein